MRADDQAALVAVFDSLFARVAALETEVAALKSANADQTPVFDPTAIAGYGAAPVASDPTAVESNTVDTGPAVPAATGPA